MILACALPRVRIISTVLPMTPIHNFFDKPMNLNISKSGEILNISGPFDRKQFEMIFTLKFSWLLIIDFKCLYFHIDFFNHQDVHTTDPPSSLIS